MNAALSRAKIVNIVTGSICCALVVVVTFVLLIMESQGVKLFKMVADIYGKFNEDMIQKYNEVLQMVIVDPSMGLVASKSKAD